MPARHFTIEGSPGTQEISLRHTATKWQSGEFNPGILALEFLKTKLFKTSL